MRSEHHFGKWLRGRREKLDYTQKTLAHEIGVTAQTVRAWEQSPRMPRLNMSHRSALARTMHLSLSDLEQIGEGLKDDAPLEVPPPPSSPAPGSRAAQSTHIANYTHAYTLLPHQEMLTSRNIRAGYLLHQYVDDPEAFAWIIEDDSMENPDGYRIGDVVIVSPAAKIVCGDDVLVMQATDPEGAARVRRVFDPDHLPEGFNDRLEKSEFQTPQGNILFLALNPRYPPVQLPRERIRSMARVVCTVIRCVGSGR